MDTANAAWQQSAMEQKEEVEHSYPHINGVRLHIAHIGKVGSVVFLHGFPEIWYSWRHQMAAVADAGFRAVAPDFRGYGLSEQPKEPEKASTDDLVADLLGIFDSLHIPKAFLIGKDFGAKPAFEFAIRHPDRVAGIVTVGVPFSPKSFVNVLQLPEGFYISRWREPGRAEADFGRFDVKTVIRNIYILFSGAEIPVAEEGQEIMDLVDLATPLPPCFTEEDLQVYADLYEKSGFQFPLQVPYRSSHKMILEVADPMVEVPSLLIMGGKDYILKFPGMEDYIRSGKVKQFVPNLKIAFIPEGTHFVQEQCPHQVSHLIITFLNNHISSNTNL